MRHLVSTNKQVLPTLHSQIREEKILNKHALHPGSWTAPTSLEHSRGWGSSSGELQKENLDYSIGPL